MENNFIKVVKIILIAFSLISFVRFVGADIISFFITPLSLSKFKTISIIRSGFFPSTRFPGFSFFLYLVTGILFLILAISLWKNYKKGFILGILGFASYLYIHGTSFLSQIAFYGILGIRQHIINLLWILFYVFSIIFLIYVYKKS